MKYTLRLDNVPISVQWAFAAILRERDYQDAKWGDIETNPHTVFEWVGIMEKELQEAKAAFFKRPAEDEMLCEILQVVSVGLACLEQHGVVERTMLTRKREIAEK